MMTTRKTVWGVVVCAVWLVSAVLQTRHASAAAPAGAPAAGAQAQDPKVLENAFFKVCGDCHEPDRIRETRRTRGGWEEIIEKMIEKGAVGNEQDFNQVLAYLLSNYGMVNMNQAGAEDIALVANLSKKDAEAIVTFRTANGKFKNFDALILVPGVDAKALEEHKASFMF